MGYLSKTSGLPSEAEGRAFESRRAHHSNKIMRLRWRDSRCQCKTAFLTPSQIGLAAQGPNQFLSGALTHRRSQPALQQIHDAADDDDRAQAHDFRS